MAKRLCAALSIRHDYDRFIKDNQLDEILSFYLNHELKSTWFILVDKPPSKYQINAILALGHEVSLHTVASSLSEFAEEVIKFRGTHWRKGPWVYVSWWN